MTPHELVETRRRQSAGEPKVAFSQEEAERIERALAQAAALRTRLEEAVTALEEIAERGQRFTSEIAAATLSRLQSEGGEADPDKIACAVCLGDGCASCRGSGVDPELDR